MASRVEPVPSGGRASASHGERAAGQKSRRAAEGEEAEGEEAANQAALTGGSVHAAEPSDCEMTDSRTDIRAADGVPAADDDELEKCTEFDGQVWWVGYRRRCSTTKWIEDSARTFGELSDFIFESPPDYLREKALARVASMPSETLAKNASEVINTWLDASDDPSDEEENANIRSIPEFAVEIVESILVHVGPEAFTEHAGALIRRIRHQDDNVSEIAFHVLKSLDPATLARHAKAVIEMFMSHGGPSYLRGKKAYLPGIERELWAKLEPSTLAQHAGVVIARLEECYDRSIREFAWETLRKLEPSALAQHADAIVATLKNTNTDVCLEALETLGQLEPATLAQHADAVVVMLEDSDGGVRNSALRTLGKLEPASLAPHADTVVAKLEDADSWVRQVALDTLGQLEPATLAPHGDALAARLDDADWWVRQVALDTLGQLEPATLAQHGDALAARLDDSKSDVRCQALKTLSKLNPAALAQHADAVVARLDDSESGVRDLALHTLGQLEPAALVQHADAVVARLDDSNAKEERIRALETLGTLELNHVLNEHWEAVFDASNDEDDDVCKQAFLTLRKIMHPEGFDEMVEETVEDLDSDVSLDRYSALRCLGNMGSEVIAQNADAVIARLADSDADVRVLALGALGALELAALASHAGAVVGALEDDDDGVRCDALEVLGKLEPHTRAQHADAVAARLDDSEAHVRAQALCTLSLGTLDPATFSQHAAAVAARVEDDDAGVRDVAFAMLPHVVTRGLQVFSTNVRSRLLARLRWHRYRQRLPLQRIALYWYALPYRPSGAGHARDVEAWGRILEE